MIYADIIVDISHEKLDRSFQYRVPKELEAEIQLGMVVTIPFGNGNHERKGYVTGLSDKPAFDISKMKPNMIPRRRRKARECPRTVKQRNPD